MKKQYMNPTMRVVVLKHRSQLLAGSGGRSVRSFTKTEGFTFEEDGIDGDDM